jgi:hypothetical protein
MSRLAIRQVSFVGRIAVVMLLEEMEKLNDPRTIWGGGVKL